MSQLEAGGRPANHPQLTASGLGRIQMPHCGTSRVRSLHSREQHSLQHFMARLSPKLAGMQGAKGQDLHLQKDAAQRLNLMSEELRNGPASFSGRNLGDDGIAYIAEAFAFNDRWGTCHMACTRCTNLLLCCELSNLRCHMLAL